MNKTLLQIIKHSIIALVVMVLSKFIGVFLFAKIFHLDTNHIFNSLYSIDGNVAEWFMVSGYSDLFMYFTVAIGFTVVLIQHSFLNKDKITLSGMEAVSRFNLSKLLKSSYQIYQSGIVWLIFLYVNNILILINYLRNITDLWILVVCSFFTISYTIIFMRDLFFEIELLTKHGETKIS